MARPAPPADSLSLFVRSASSRHLVLSRHFSYKSAKRVRAIGDESERVCTKRKEARPPQRHARDVLAHVPRAKKAMSWEETGRGKNFLKGLWLRACSLSAVLGERRAFLPCRCFCIFRPGLHRANLACVYTYLLLCGRFGPSALTQRTLSLYGQTDVRRERNGWAFASPFPWEGRRSAGHLGVRDDSVAATA